jgi:hypothetical protein
MHRRPARPTPTSSGAGSRTSVALLILIAVLIIVRCGVTEFGDVLGTNVRHQLQQVQAKKKGDKKSTTDAKSEVPLPESLPAEAFLKGYADPDTQPQEDLTRLAHALEHLAKVTSEGDAPTLNTNEDLAAALLGENPAGVPFLPEKHPLFNSKREIVDRWGTPLQFSSPSRGHWKIRSAGPDRIMNTADDLRRQPQ